MSDETEPTRIIDIVDNKLLYHGMVVGRVALEASLDEPVAEPVIVLNLGWAREAGVHVRVLDDPEVDRHRDGKVLER